jgi:hypothetical protein
MLRPLPLLRSHQRHLELVRIETTLCMAKVTLCPPKMQVFGWVLGSSVAFMMAMF